jgi:hypothetical protein
MEFEHRRKLAQQIYRSLCDDSTPIDVIVQTLDKFDELKDDPYLVYKHIAKGSLVANMKRRYEKLGK